jgi:hypothetical protein
MATKTVIETCPNCNGNKNSFYNHETGETHCYKCLDSGLVEVSYQTHKNHERKAAQAQAIKDLQKKIEAEILVKVKGYLAELETMQGVYYDQTGLEDEAYCIVCLFGETFPYKEQIKKLGFKWNGEMWVANYTMVLLYDEAKKRLTFK